MIDSIDSIIGVQAGDGLDYFVFCRVILGKYLLYEFNTLMLLLFLEVPAEHAHSLLCVLSLLEAAYPYSIEDMIEVICPDFPLDLTRFFPGKHFIQFLANKMRCFRNFVFI